MALMSHMFRGNVKCFQCFINSNNRWLYYLSIHNNKDVHSNPLTERYVLKRFRTTTSHLSHQPVTFNVNTVCFYSQNKTSVTGITDQILKAKHGEGTDKLETSAEPEQKSEKSSKDDKSKSNSWFSPKHAWKLGLLSLGAATVLMCGNLLFIWGRFQGTSYLAL